MEGLVVVMVGGGAITTGAATAAAPGFIMAAMAAMLGIAAAAVPPAPPAAMAANMACICAIWAAIMAAGSEALACPGSGCPLAAIICRHCCCMAIICCNCWAGFSAPKAAPEVGCCEEGVEAPLPMGVWPVGTGGRAGGVLPAEAALPRSASSGLPAALPPDFGGGGREGCEPGDDADPAGGGGGRDGAPFDMDDLRSVFANSSNKKDKKRGS